MRIILIIGLIALTGCASGGQTGICLNINGTGMTTPWTGGKLDAHGILCHLGEDAFSKGVQPTPEQLAEVMKSFISENSGKMDIPSAGTITFTPSK